MNVRQATWKDWNRIVGLRLAAFAETLDSDPMLHPGDMALAGFDASLQLGCWLKDGAITVLLATDQDDLPVGYLVLSTDRSCPYRQERTVWIDGFFVVKSARTGVAAGLLMRAAKRLAAKAGIKFAQAVVLAHNTEVHHMLRDHGFVAQGVVYERELDDGRRKLQPEASA